MAVTFNAAFNAYNNAAKIASDTSDNASSSNATGGAAGSGFAQIINNSLSSASSSIRQAENTISKSLVKQADITDVVTAITNAELTLKTVIEVRNKLILAHQEIMKMPI